MASIPGPLPWLRNGEGCLWPGSMPSSSPGVLLGSAHGGSEVEGSDHLWSALLRMCGAALSFDGLWPAGRVAGSRLAGEGRLNLS